MKLTKRIATVFLAVFFSLFFLPEIAFGYSIGAEAGVRQGVIGESAGIGSEFSDSIPEDDLLGLEYGKASGLGSQDVRITVGMIIQSIIGLLGAITVVLILYAGFKWMTAGGADDKVGEAKKILTAAVIGLAIILSAYAITRFVTESLYRATTNVRYGR